MIEEKPDESIFEKMAAEQEAFEKAQRKKNYSRDRKIVREEKTEPDV